MNLSASACTLLTHLSATWPSPRPSFTEADGVTIPATDPLAGEVGALAEGRAASLPYYLPGRDEIAWVTVAPDAEALQTAVADLRAWIIPSFGWEDPLRPIVRHRGGANAVDGNQVVNALAELAPAGYFRWRSRRADAATIAEKFKGLRNLLESRPHHAVVRVPSLLELRQLFDVACAAGNRATAEGAINSIDHLQLDTASNTAFMRILLADTFGEAEALVAAEETRRLVALRLPGRVRTAILHAFFHVHLRNAETAGDLSAAAAAYAAHVDPDVGGLVAAAPATDSPLIARLRGYRALLRADATLATEVLNVLDDGAFEALLRPLVAPEFDAQLEPLQAQAATAQVEAALDPEMPALVPEATARSWLGWLQQLRAEQWTVAARFVDEPHPPIATLTAAQITELSFAMEDVYTGGDFGTDGPLVRALLLGLPSMIQQFTTDDAFPETRLGDLYEQLLLVWVHVRCGSLVEVDGQLLLSLADAVLRGKPTATNQVAEQLRQWWDARPLRAMLPFGYEAVDLLLDLANNSDAASALWFAAANVAHQNRGALSPTDRSLLRYLAGRLNVDDAVVDGYLPLEAQQEDADPLAGTGLRKIAILHSWAADAARRAAELLRARTGADVMVVQAEEKTATVQSAARNCTVLLFLPRRSAHQLFYALDLSARAKIVYVPGSTASSIVLALEQWVSALAQH